MLYLFLLGPPTRVAAKSKTTDHENGNHKHDHKKNATNLEPRRRFLPPGTQIIFSFFDSSSIGTVNRLDRNFETNSSLSDIPRTLELSFAVAAVTTQYKVEHRGLKLSVSLIIFSIILERYLSRGRKGAFGRCVEQFF